LCVEKIRPNGGIVGVSTPLSLPESLQSTRSDDDCSDRPGDGNGDGNGDGDGDGDGDDDGDGDGDWDWDWDGLESLRMRFWAVGFCGLGRIGIFMVDNIVDQVIECI
jgi:hypothetical protein